MDSNNNMRTTRTLATKDTPAAKEELQFLLENVLRNLKEGTSVTSAMHTLNIRLAAIKSKFWKSTQQR